MKPPRRSLTPFWLLAACLLWLPLAAKDDARWVASWVTSLQPTDPVALQPSLPLAGCTLRQIIQPTLAGSRVRVALSNQYGEKPLVLSGAHIARSLGGSDIDPASDRPLTFSGQASVTLLPGASMLSDDVDLPVEAFVNLALSVRFDSLPTRVSGHPGSRTTSYVQSGDALSLPSLQSPTKIDQWFVISSLEVLADPQAAAIVVIGDSITDGRGSTTNLNDRWPNLLARRLHAAAPTSGLAVLNQGVGASRVLRDGVGDSILRRFDRDVLALPGLRCLVIFSGVNDIGTAYTPATRQQRAPVAKELIQAYHQLLLRAHAHGLRVIGTTIMPFEGFDSYYHANSEADRQEVNEWIRKSGEFDGVIDFDQITRDPKNPVHLAATVDGGDHLHPCAAGYKLMADAIDLSIFQPSPR